MIMAMNRAKDVSSDATLEHLIQGLYAWPERHIDRPEHRWL
jgi:hypothetical protein